VWREGLLLTAVVLLAGRRQGHRQTLAIAAAREAMHQRAVETQQRNLTALRALRLGHHRQSLEAGAAAAGRWTERASAGYGAGN
jgi:hypothetical protein